MGGAEGAEGAEGRGVVVIRQGYTVSTYVPWNLVFACNRCCSASLNLLAISTDPASRFRVSA